MLIRYFRQNTTYRVRASRGLRFPVVFVFCGGSSPAKRPVSSIWPPVVGLMDLSVRAVGTSIRYLITQLGQCAEILEAAGLSDIGDHSPQYEGLLGCLRVVWLLGRAFSMTGTE